MSASTTGGARVPFLVAAGLILVLGVGAIACRGGGRDATAETDGAGMAQSMNPIAAGYVRLVLALGEHDPDYVDAYYGPEEWSKEAKTARQPLDAIRRAAGPLVQRLAAIDLTGAEELVRLRRDYLRRQLEALIARVEILQGRTMTFDGESKALYDEVAPVHPDGRFQQVIDRLDPLLPGKGTLIERYEAYKKSFIIPPEKLGAVFTAAIDEARRRTRAHIDLPED